MRNLSIIVALVAGCTGDFADSSRRFAEPTPGDASLHPIQIEAPPGLGELETALTDIHGQPVGVACATCHGPDPTSALAHREGPETPVHEAIDLQHGTLTCDACHDPGDRTALRLADGTRLPMVEAMTLCAQCHGVQARDYRRGSHGGMRGYWDLKRGPRERNHCLDCHRAHAPAYGRFQPVLPPRDRYFSTERRSEGDH